jgi:hypothetical protein
MRSTRLALFAPHQQPQLPGREGVFDNIVLGFAHKHNMMLGVVS